MRFTGGVLPTVNRSHGKARQEMGRDTLTITDNRTGRTYELPVTHGTYEKYGSAISAMDLRQIKLDDDDFGLITYDPGLTNSGSAMSSITFIDGEKGILRYRGYPIEELADNATFLEVAYLLIYGELPTAGQFSAWESDILGKRLVHENLKKFMSGFWHNAHAMGVFVGTVGAMSTFHPEAKNVTDAEERLRQAVIMLARIPTVAAFSYRHSLGLPYAYPEPNSSYVGGFLEMLHRQCDEYEVQPVIERAMEVLFILHADHEQNCSTTTMRTIGSSHADPYCALAGAAGALHGQLHGGANQEALLMLEQIGDRDNIPEFIEKVKAKKTKLMGFGHRVYKNYDPRAKIIKKMADEVFAVTKPDPLIDIAKALEEIALSDDYFISRKLYPNVDFYSGLIYKALGFPVDMFPVLFAIARTSGWLAHWIENHGDTHQRIVRPRQVYTGEDVRAYVPIENR